MLTMVERCPFRDLKSVLFGILRCPLWDLEMSSLGSFRVSSKGSFALAVSFWLLMALASDGLK